MVAPRALLCIESTDDLFANPAGTYATSAAAMPVFALWGAETLNGLRYRRGGHSFSDEDWRVLLDFAEWQFFLRPSAGAGSFWQQPATITPSSRSGGEPGFVKVGDPGNKADVDRPRVGSFGAVDYVYEIGRHKVSNAEYAVFLNALAAKTDPHRLYHSQMKIRRGGKEGEYVYVAHPASANAAVTYVTWHDALRYCNWLHGGDSEQGAYPFSGETLVGARQAGARFFLPSEDEWYKAACYDPESQGYRLFPLRDAHQLIHGRKLPPKSSYGILGAADPIWEWTESKVGEQFRGLRSDSWFQGNNRQAVGHFYSNPDLELGHVGFRIARAVAPIESPLAFFEL